MLGEQSPDRGRLYQDGVLTSRNTFQKYFSQNEFREYIRYVLDEEPVAVDPSVFFIFFVFKDKDAEQSFLAKRYRNRGTANRLVQRFLAKIWLKNNSNFMKSIRPCWIPYG